MVELKDQLVHLVPRVKIKVSKKVSVSLNENKKPTQPVKKPGVGVKVNVKK